MGQRVVIVDYNHLAHRYLRGARPLSIKVFVNGDFVDYTTTIPAYSLKWLAGITKYGLNPSLIVMDRPVPSRREYFSKLKQRGKTAGTTEAIAYKDGRASAGQELYTGIRDTQKILINGGVSVAMVDNYEADDLILPAIEYAKKAYPGLPIDIITGDGDLIPLVDDQVNVYMRGKYTLHEEGSPELMKYIQVTKNNWSEALSFITAFKDYDVPYNASLLVKLFRGDPSDNLKPITGFTPTKMRKLFEDLREADVDFDKLARYGRNREVWVKVDDPNNQELWRADQAPGYAVAYLDSAELKHMVDVLKPFVEREHLVEMVARYRGMNLNASFSGLNVNRRPHPEIPFGTYDITQLQESAKSLKINIKVK